MTDNDPNETEGLIIVGGGFILILLFAVFCLAFPRAAVIMVLAVVAVCLGVKVILRYWLKSNERDIPCSSTDKAADVEED